MKTPTTTETGHWGETLAEEHLREKGFEILEKNWRWKRAEIDLIALDGPCLVFVEVKTRKNSDFGHPEEFVDQTKARRIKTASVEFQISRNYQGFIRFDIVSITGTRDRFEIFHLPDAF